MDEPKLNLAALGALANGDLANFLVAATPGGIVAQERAGQAALAADTTLPAECTNADAAALATLGIQIGAAVDPLFVVATLPPGWRKVPTDHAMWTDLQDDRGRVRGAIFYKAAFYDRSAFWRLRCRYGRMTGFGAYPATDEPYHADQVRWVGVRDNATGAVLWHSADHRSNDYPTADTADHAAKSWLAEHYPRYDDPLAYWDND